MTTLLFDIDGTLISTGGAGSAAMRSAFCTVFQCENPQDVAYSGRTDVAIGRELLERNSILPTPENWSLLRGEYLAQLPNFLPKCAGRTLPGVSELLERLAEIPLHGVGLLTGNVREGARLKLDHYGLFKHFAFGGFGDEHVDRNQVAEVALSAARQHSNGQFRDDAVWVIGDTPFDIRCGRWIGARVIAVATGIHPREELERDKPDILLDDLSEVDAVLEILA